MSSADQALEVLAGLSLNKTLLAEVLGVSRPALYDWFEGKEPNLTNARRLTTLVQLLANAGVTAAHALSPRFVREALNDGEPSLLELLKADTLDEARISKVLREAKAIDDGVENERLTREDRLRALGFGEPTAEQRKANLALDMALRQWPKDRQDTGPADDGGVSHGQADGH
jgi:AcrR family transcriptional regulator